MGLGDFFLLRFIIHCLAPSNGTNPLVLTVNLGTSQLSWAFQNGLSKER